MPYPNYTADERAQISNARDNAQAELLQLFATRPASADATRGGLKNRGLQGVDALADPDFFADSSSRAEWMADLRACGATDAQIARWTTAAKAYRLLALTNAASDAPGNTNAADKGNVAAQAAQLAASGGADATAAVLAQPSSAPKFRTDVLPFLISRVVDGHNVGSFNPTIAEYDAYADPTGAHPEVRWGNLTRGQQTTLLGPFAAQWFAALGELPAPTQGAAVIVTSSARLAGITTRGYSQYRPGLTPLVDDGAAIQKTTADANITGSLSIGPVEVIILLVAGWFLFK